MFFDASFVLADGDVPLRACPYVLSMKVEPCVPAAAFQTSAPHAGFDERARLTLTQDLDAETLTALAATYDARIAWQVGNLNSAFDLPLFFDAPDDFVLQAEPGERGPDLRIVVSQEPHDRVRFDLEGPMGHRFLVVEQKALADLKVGSRGGVGTPGERGAAGAEGRNGVNGRNAVCPSLIGSAGGPGEPGGQGEPGGPGGVGADGGTVTVEVACACPDLRAALGEVIVAEGGPGGSGGAGGQGGPGGRGGQGGAEATCRDVLVDGTASFVAGGFDGPNGMRGEAGLSGATGPSGAPGTVTFVP